MGLFCVIDEWRRENYLTRKNGRRVALEMELNEGDKLLDVGCGNGEILSFVKQRYPKARFYGIDILPSALAKADKSMKGVFKLAGAEKIPWGDDSFDCAVSTLVLHHMNNGKEGIAEISRVLKSGSKFYLSDIAPIPLFRKIVNFFYWIICGANRIYSKEEIRSLLIKHNFKIIEEKKLSWWGNWLFVAKKRS